jgi:tetratricopeptide (TPR) repeat protein
MVTIAEATTIAFQAYQSGNLQQAEGICRQILQQQPDHAAVLHLLGVVFHQTGRLVDAVTCYQRAIAVLPTYAEAHNSLGVVLQRLGQLEAAASHLQTAIDLQPDYVQAHLNLGNVYQDQGNLAAAIEQFQQAIALKPDYAQAHNNLGSALQQQGQLQIAITHFYLALTYQPNSAIARSNLGSAFQEQGDFATAIDYYQQALQLQPQDANVHYNLGNAYRELEQLNLAIDHYQQALQLQPNFVEALVNLGLALKDDSQMDEATVHLQAALELQPQSANAHATLGDVLLDQGDVQAALACFEQALAIEPHHLHARYHRGFAQLLLGELGQGFDDYTAYLRHGLPLSPAQWQDTDLRGQKILLTCSDELGFGDAIQYVRYAKLLVDRGAQVIVQCPAPLARLFRTIAGVEGVVTQVPEGLEFSIQVPLLLLPWLWGTTLSTIPAQPYLSLPSETFPLGTAGDDRCKVGIVWSGMRRFRNIYRDRSCPLSQFQPLLALPHIAFYSLQRGEAAADLAHLPAGQVQDLSDRLQDFADTAAAIAQLDLVITIDTAVAYLAGALGRPVWVLLPYAPDCRWLLDRADSPWYPTMRLFRQQAPGDWQGAIAQVTSALQNWQKT